MANFNLIMWTTCQTCYGEKFVYGVIKNTTSQTRTITIVIADNDGNNVGQADEIVAAYEYGSFYINPTLPNDYTNKIYCAGYVNNILQFNNYKYQYFDATDGCKAPNAPTNVTAICKENGTCNISWSQLTDNDIFTYVIERYKNNIYDVSFDTYGINTNLTDDTINNCSNIYSYLVFAVDKAFRDGANSQKVNATPYVQPCSIPISNFTLIKTTFTIGDIVTATSTSTAGTGATISEYEWKWDGTIISGTSTNSVITIDTTGKTAGTHTISLKIKNSCGNWSTVKTISVVLTDEICISKWICELDLDSLNTGWKIDGCGNTLLDVIKCPVGQKPPEESNILIPIAIGIGLLAIGLKMLDKK